MAVTRELIDQLQNDQMFYDQYLSGGVGIPLRTANNYSLRDEYLMRRYRQLENMAYELCRGRNDLSNVVTALATLDVVETLRELPERMPKVKIEQPNIDVRVIVDKIQALMSEIYK